jgi:hypothetical protein
MFQGPAREMRCPLCGGPTKHSGGLPEANFQCEVCGNFQVAFELLPDRDIKDRIHPYLSAATRKANESRRVLRLDPYNWRNLEMSNALSEFRKRSRISLD